jgi:hypothetical protein
LKPLSRRELIRKFRRLGFDGPISGGRHPYMEKGPLKVHITGEHQGDVTVALQKEILSHAGISTEEWDQA